MEDFEKKWRGDFGSSWKNIQPWFTYSSMIFINGGVISPGLRVIESHAFNVEASGKIERNI